MAREHETIACVALFVLIGTPVGAVSRVPVHLNFLGKASPESSLVSRPSRKINKNSPRYSNDKRHERFHLVHVGPICVMCYRITHGPGADQAPGVGLIPDQESLHKSGTALLSFGNPAALLLARAVLRGLLRNKPLPKEQKQYATESTTEQGWNNPQPDTGFT
jgi:hypothetical protein